MQAGTDGKKTERQRNNERQTETLTDRQTEMYRPVEILHVN